MPTLSKKWFVIVNPTSGNGKSKKKWPKIKKLLELYNFDYKFAFTEYSKHSILLVHKVVEKGITNIICVGGDGTLHNVVNGIMTQKKVPSKTIKVGMIPIGTGNDWVKTHCIPMKIEAAIKTILKETISCQDVGKIEFIDLKSEPIFFNNLAGVGFDGYVVHKVHKYKHLGAFAYLLGALIGLFSFENFNSTVSLNSKKYTGKTLMVLVGIGQYSGGGMQLTKSPNPFDGLFDISIAKYLSKLEIIKNLGNLFNGKITNLTNIESVKDSNVEIRISEKKSPYIQADGEVIGTGNIKFELVPKAFSFYS